MLVFFPKPNRLKEKHKNMDDYFALYRKQKAATIERIPTAVHGRPYGHKPAAAGF